MLHRVSGAMCWTSCRAGNIRDRSNEVRTRDQKRSTLEARHSEVLDRKVSSFFSLCSLGLCKNPLYTFVGKTFGQKCLKDATFSFGQ